MRCNAMRLICLLVLASLTCLGGCLETVQGNLKKEWGLKAYYDEQDKQKAFSMFQESAQDGDSEGQYLLGLMLLSGDDVPQNVDAGLRWIHKAADQGLLDAENKLGFVYLSGLHGAPQDTDQAVSYLTRAADRGELNAMLALGLAYSTQPSVQNFERAASWYARARANGADIPEEVTDPAFLASSAAKDKPRRTIDSDTRLVLEVQQRLKDLGYDPGPVDGIPGKLTEAAVRRYQEDTNLPVDGVASQELLESLKQSSGQM